MRNDFCSLFRRFVFQTPGDPKLPAIRSQYEIVRTAPWWLALRKGLGTAMLSAVVAAFSLFLVGLTALPLLPSGLWWVRIWDFPRQQLALLLALCAAAQIALWPESLAAQAVLGVTLLALCWQLWWIFPYTPLRRLQVQSAVRGGDPDQRIRLLIANVLQHNRNIHGLYRNISVFNPDVVLILEADDWWSRHLAAMAHRYPQKVLRPQENTYGMLLFSRLEVVNVTVRELVTEGVPSIKALIRLRSGQLVELYCLHPEPPVVGAHAYERDAEILLVARESVRSPYPVIVCGDMNDVAWSRTTRLFQRVSGLLDPRIGRGLYSTFDARRWYARWPLDHVFHDRRFLLNHLQLGRKLGSDHFPIIVELAYHPDAAERQETPRSADSADHREADEKIETGQEEAGRVPEKAPARAEMAVTTPLK